MTTTPTIPDRFVDNAVVDTVAVAPSNTVKSGDLVKLSPSPPADPNVREIVRATAATDHAFGIVRGPLGVNAKTFAAGEKCQITTFPLIVERGIAGSGGVTAGSDVVASTAGTLVNAPSFVAGGATLVRSPGWALDTVAAGEAFSFAYEPWAYVTT